MQRCGVGGEHVAGVLSFLFADSFVRSMIVMCAGVCILLSPRLLFVRAAHIIFYSVV